MNSDQQLLVHRHDADRDVNRSEQRNRGADWQNLRVPVCCVRCDRSFMTR